MDQNSNQTSLLSTLSNQLADAVETASKSLVLVNARQRHPASGVVYAQDMVLTADHVIERDEDITVVTADGRELPAQLAGRAPASDIALLKVPGLNVEPATAASADARVGQMVLAVGRPGDSGPMASSGIVSSIGGPIRTGQGGVLEKFIRTDATPYPGFSGGPLIDVTGAVVGITTTGLGRGVALAIPASNAWRIGDTLAQHGGIKRGYLGVSSQPVYLPEGHRGGRAQENGLLIVRVEDNSPAANAGLLIGDIVVGLDGQVISDAESLQSLLSGGRVGQTAPVEVIRGGALQTLQVTIGERK